MPIGGAYLHRALQQRLTQVLRRRLRNLHFEDGSLIPTVPDLEPGAREIVQDQVLEYGEAKLTAADADDVPLIEVSTSENTFRVVMAVAGFSISFQEERAMSLAAKNGRNYQIRDTKMSGARRVIAERINKVAAYGDTALNFTGMINDADVTLTNSSFDPFASTTTAQDLADFVLEELENVATDSNNVEFPTDLLTSTEFMFLLKRRQMPDSGIPVLDYIIDVQNERNNPSGIKRLRGLQELRSANLEASGVQSSGTNKDRFVLYPLDPEVLERHNEITQLMPEDYVQVKGTRKLYPMFGCTSQSILNFPGAFRYVDHAKKA